MKSSFTSDGTVAIRRAKWLDYLALAKPELTLLSVVTALGGAYLASGNPVPFWLIIHTFIGTILVGAGAGSLNQYAEREHDAMMRRTENRPLPSGRLEPREALMFGSVAALGGVLYLSAFTNTVAGFLAVVTLVTYLFLYTPLKRITPFATVIGGIPGALPPMIGWSAVAGGLTMGAWALFFILFFWQMPHFLSLAWMYRKDYARAGYRLLTVDDPTGLVASRQILIHSAALLPAALMPTMVGVLGVTYFVGAFLLSSGFLLLAIRLYQNRTNGNARRLFFASLVYLSVLVGLMIF
ncbi:MAG: heme o synthase, partial [Bacteroidota bacterium]